MRDHSDKLKSFVWRDIENELTYQIDMMINFEKKQQYRPTAILEYMALTSLKTPNGGHYIQQITVPLFPAQNLDSLKKAWELAAQRHIALRAFFTHHQGSLLLEFADHITPSIEVISVPDHADQTGEEQLNRFLEEDRKKGFDLSSPPLWRFTVWAQKSGSNIGIWTFHHALLDGRSHMQVLRELQQSIQAETPLVRLHPQQQVAFPAFLKWATEPAKECTRSYWARRMNDFVSAPVLPSLEIEQDSMANENPNAHETICINEEDTQKLRVTAKRHGVTLNNLVQAVWALALGRYNAVQDVTFGTIRSGRYWNGNDSSESVGMFIQTVPFRVTVQPDQPLNEWLQKIQKQQRDLRGNEFISVADICQWAKLPSGTPLWKTLLMFEQRDVDEWDQERSALRLHEKIDQLSLAAYAGKKLRLCIEFSTQTHPEEQIRTVLAHLRNLLQSIASAPEELPIGRLSMMLPDEQEQVLSWGKGMRMPLPEHPLVRRLERQALRYPDHIAVEFEENQLSYRELHSQANQLARRLRALPSRPQRVGVFLDRSPEQVIVWLALMKAGIAYAPIDPATPPQRLDFLLQDIEPAIILSQQDLLARLKATDIPKLCMDDPAELEMLRTFSTEALDDLPSPQSASQLMSTSGSTGKPKAAMLTFEGMDHLTQTFAAIINIKSSDRIVQLSSTVFDFSLGEILLAIMSGATLVMGRWATLKPGPALTQFMEARKITVLAPTPSALHATPCRAFPDLRLVLSGGEALPTALAQEWGKERRIVNVFGPSECTFWTTCDINTLKDWIPTLGHPVGNVQVYILNANGQLQPKGVPGELYIGGAGVGLGYWKRPELTREKFLPDPFSEVPDAHMYRTGDLVRWLPDGRIQFLGRIDHQIKFKGVRLELGEIEATLELHPQVRQAVVMIRDEQLEAWVVPQKTPTDPKELKEWMSRHQPLAFIPEKFHCCAEFPKLGSGKVDRKRLASEASCAPKLPPASFGKIQSFPLERTVLNLFHEQVQKHPEAIAIKGGEKQISYAELDHQSHRIAEELLKHSLPLETPILLLLPPSVEFVAAALGVLKAGCSYLPTDPATPDARLKYLLKDSQSPIVLTNTGGIKRLKTEEVTALNITQIKDSETPQPLPKTNATHRAYIIYTSGSTGQPKGTEIEHHSLSNLVFHYQQQLDLKPGHRATLLANVAFDASVADLWPTLCSGGKLLIPPCGLQHTPDALIQWLVEEKTTWSFIPTGLAEILFNRPWPQELTMRFLLTGGDRLTIRPPQGFPVQVINTYGPTENTVDSTWAIVDPQTDETQPPPPIGLPTTNVNTYLLDPNLQPVENTEEGEIYLGGEQVARGYLNQPELTAQRFLPDPFSPSPNARMYRTGDRARWSEESEMEFIGRNDDQIQIRGHRVELAEIEASLLTHPSILHTCCLPRSTSGRVVGITAHIVFHPESDEPSSTLSAYLEKQLPKQMLPSAFVQHKALPLTAAGKYDRKALLAMQPESEPHSAIEVISGLESALARLWNTLLPTAKSAPLDAKFSELGGDSLTAIRLQLGVEEITQRRIELSTLLLNATVEGFLEAVQSRLKNMEFQSVLTLQKSGSRPPLFLVYEGSGDVNIYFDLVEALGKDQPIYGIRSPALEDPTKTPDSIETAATEILNNIQSVHPQTPPALLGYSLGGLLAYETARQHKQQTGKEGFTALIGTMSPLQPITRANRILHFTKTLPRWAWNLALDTENRHNRIARWKDMAEKTKENLIENRNVELPTPAWASSDLSKQLVKISRAYRPETNTQIQIDYFRERLVEGQTNLPSPRPLRPWFNAWKPDYGWEQWAGLPPNIHWINATHRSVLSAPYVQNLAFALRRAMPQ